MVKRLAVDLLVPVAVGAAAGLCAAAGLYWAVGVWAAIAYVLGRVLEGRQWMRLERERTAETLEAFTSWAESVLAAAPEELDAEGEAQREQLQAHYQAAQAYLQELRR